MDNLSAEFIATVIATVAILGLGWKVTSGVDDKLDKMHKENKAAHDQIGDNITGLKTDLNARMERMETRIDTRIERMESHLREDNAETRKRIDRLFDQRAT